MSDMTPRLPLIYAALFMFTGKALSMIAIEEGPSNVTVIQGQDALFTCRIRNKGRTGVSWYSFSTGTRISVDWSVDPGIRPTAGEYRIEGDPNVGDINLKITQVQPEDAGRYMCGYEMGREYISSGAYLTVLVPPGDVYPMCVQPDTQDLAVGDSVRLQCLSHGGSPPAKLVWIKDDLELTDGKEYNNAFDWILDLSDLNSQFVCRAESPAITQPRTCTTSIQLQEPVVTIHPIVGKVEVGYTLTFLCRRQDKPTETRFRWFFRGGEITPTTSSRFNISDDNRALTIRDIEEGDRSAEVKCAVSVLPELLDYSAEGVILVSIITGEVLGTHPPPRWRTNIPPERGTSSNGQRGDNELSTAGMLASEEGKPSHGSMAMIVILGAGGGLLIVALGVVINCVLMKRKGQKESEPKPKADIRPVGSGLSLMTTKDSDRSLSSSDSVVTTKTMMTSTNSKKDISSISKNTLKEGSHYTELDANELRLSEYQELNSPPNSIYAEPVLAPTKLVPRPQHQDGFHDYALPDILPVQSPDDYVEPDPPPRSKKTKQQQQGQNKENKEANKGNKEANKGNKEANKENKNANGEEIPPKKNNESLYIEIIA